MQFGRIKSALLFDWAGELLTRGTNRPHTLESLIPLPRPLEAAATSTHFEEALDLSCRRPVIRALVRLHARDFLKPLCLMLLHVAGLILNPLLIRSLIGILSGTPLAWDPVRHVLPQDNMFAAVLLACLVYVSALTVAASVQLAFFYLLKISSRLKSSLILAIYKKALRLSRQEKQSIPNGNIVNLMASDVNKLHMLATFIHSLFTHPVQIAAVLFLLYLILGWASFLGALVMLILLGTTVLLARINAGLRRRILGISDRRVSLLNEILSYMRIIKLYGWERSFRSEVSKLRRMELSLLRKGALVLVCINSIFQSAPVIITAATFSAVAALGDVPPLADLFAAIILYGVLRYGMTSLPETIILLFESNLSLKRLENFFSLSEHKRPLSDETLARGAVSFENASISWDGKTASLSDVNFSVKPGELVCLLGPVGSGKTALLLAILGELKLLTGRLRFNGTLGYLPQQPWIVNESLKNNITLGAAGSAKRYQACLEVADLKEDLRALPAGDETEIGERGINLSGGQKQRISIARAAYSDRDIYLMDDPFSALDAEVREKVFRSFVKRFLKGKTVIVCTHLPDIARRADRVLMLENGRILEKAYWPEKALPLETSGEQFSLRAETESLPQSELSQHLFETSSEEAGIELQTGGRIIEKEERKTGHVELAVYKEYARLFAPGILAAVILLLFIFKDLVQIANDSWLSWWSGGNVPEIDRFLFWYVVLACGVALISFIRTAFVRLRGLKAGGDMHERLLNRVLSAPLSFFDATPVGRIINRFSGDIEAVDITVPYTLTEVLSSLSAILMSISLVMVINPWLLMILPPLSVLYYRFQKQFRPTSREGQRLESITRSPIFAQYSESLSGLSTIRAFGWERIFIPRLIKAVDDNQRCFYSLVAANRWLGMRLEILGATVAFFAALAPVLAGTYFGAAGAGLGVLYALGMTGSLNWFIRMTTQLEGNMNSVERIGHYSRIEIERWDGRIPPSSWPERGVVEFKNIEVAYKSAAKPVLKNISALIEPGERIGIAGRTGAGKSTIVLALTRLVELSRGQIFIDGLDIAELSLEELRGALAVIPQDPVMFLGSLRGNLDPFAQFTDEEIWKALERTHISEFIRSLPRGLQSGVSEGGQNFSSGQRQLICLARALLRQNKIIILDEATANVDPATDNLIQETVRREFSGKTILTIAHRLSTILDYDRVMVLDKGRIVEFDSVKNLLEKPGGRLRQMLGR